MKLEIYFLKHHKASIHKVPVKNFHFEIVKTIAYNYINYYNFEFNSTTFFVSFG